MYATTSMPEVDMKPSQSILSSITTTLPSGLIQLKLTLASELFASLINAFALTHPGWDVTEDGHGNLFIQLAS